MEFIVTGPSGMPIIGRVRQKMDLLREIGLRVGTIFEIWWLFWGGEEQRVMKFPKFQKKFIEQIPEKVSRRGIQEDLAFVKCALLRAYAGVLCFENKTVERVLESLNAIVEAPVDTPLAFAEKIREALAQLPDKHLMLFLRGECLNSEIINRRESVNIANGNLWKLEIAQGEFGKVAILGITEFLDPSDAGWAGLMEKVQAHFDAHAFVIDLRGNRGGNDTMAYRIASALAGVELDTFWYDEHILWTEESVQLQINTFDWMTWKKYLSKNLPVPDGLQERIRTLEHKLREVVDGTHAVVQVTKAIPRPSLGPTSFTGKVFVLVDKYTVSSGESAAEVFRVFPHSRRFGSPTAGLVHFCNSGNLFLPNSHLQIVFAMKYNRYVDGGFYEETGLPVDESVAEGDDALDLVFRDLIGNEKDERQL
jgi:hypothetical protein